VVDVSAVPTLVGLRFLAGEWTVHPRSRSGSHTGARAGSAGADD